MDLRPLLSAAILGLALPAIALAQAESTFPGTLSCDPLPSAKAPLRVPVTVRIAGGRATYASAAQGSAGENGTETGAGTLSIDRRLLLSGQGNARGFAYTARYAGEVGGRGGLLAGTQTWTIGGKSQSRACQLVLGNG